MMIRYSGLLTKLRTKQIKFEDFLITNEPWTLEQLREASSKRRLIEDFINKNTCMTEAIAREMSGGLTSRCEQDIQKLENYLPLLENLIYSVELISVDKKINTWIKDLKIRWSSGLISSPLINCNGPKLYQINNLRFELGMTLFLYGDKLRQRGQELLCTDLVQSATFFRKASGVYDYIANEVLPPLQKVLPPDRPPEVASCLSAIMSLICLAEAQAVTARKAEEKGNSESLVAKLQCGVKEFLDEAVSIHSSSTKELKDISSRFLDYLWSCQKIHGLKSFKYFAESLKKDEKMGSGIGILRGQLLNAHKNMPKEDSWRSVSKQVTEEITCLVHKYEHENEVVWQQKIPGHYELPTPEGVKVVKAIPYKSQRCERTLVFKQ